MNLTLEIHNDQETIELEIQPATGGIVELAIEQTVREFVFEVDVLRGPAGPPGIQGPIGPSGQSYEHIQASAAAEWIINHNLGFYPNVSTVTSAGDKIEGDVSYPSINTVIVRFASALGGKAYIS